MIQERAPTRRQALRIIGTGTVAGLAGCLGGPRGSTGPRQVGMDALEFVPARISVDVGRTVEWVNETDIGHTVTAYEAELPTGATYFASGGFDSESAARSDLQGSLMASGETYRYTFEAAGEHPYFCVPHEGSGMTGVVVVG